MANNDGTNTNTKLPDWLRNSSFPSGSAALIQQIYAVNQVDEQAGKSEIGAEKLDDHKRTIDQTTQDTSCLPPAKKKLVVSQTIDDTDARRKAVYDTVKKSSEVIPGVFVDKHGDPNNVGFQGAYRKNIPRYTLLRTSKASAPLHDRRNQTVKQPGRYFELKKVSAKKRKIIAVDEKETSSDQGLLRMNAELNRRIAQDSRNVRNWLALFRFQDVLLRSPSAFLSEITANSKTSSSKWSRKIRLSELAIVERKLAILQRAADANPAFALFRILKIQLSRIVDARHFSETARVIREYDDLCFRLPTSRIAFDAVERFALQAAVNEPAGYSDLGSHRRDRQIAPRRVFAKSIRNFVRLNAGELRSHNAADDTYEVLLTYAAHALVFDAETDHSELAFSCLQCMFEFALRMPAAYVSRSLDEQRALFEPFFDSNFSRFGDELPVSSEDVASSAARLSPGWSAWFAIRGKPGSNAVVPADTKLQEYAESEEGQLIKKFTEQRSAGVNEQRLDVWRAVEVLRAETLQFAYRGDASDCADIDRVIDVDDVTSLLFRVDYAKATDPDAAVRNDAFRFSMVRFLLEAIFGIAIRPIASTANVNVSKTQRARCLATSFHECSLSRAVARERLVLFKRNLLTDVTECFTDAAQRNRLAEALLHFEMATFAKSKTHATASSANDSSFKSQAKRIRTASRNLLKRPENRNSMRLFCCYIELEAQLGNVKESREIQVRTVSFSAETFKQVDVVFEMVVSESDSTVSTVASHLASLPNTDTLFECVELVRLGLELELGVVTELELDTLFDLRSSMCNACRSARADRIYAPQQRVVEETHLLHLFERLFGYEPLESELADLRLVRLRRKLEKIRMCELANKLLLFQAREDVHSCLSAASFIAHLIHIKGLFVIAFDGGNLVDFVDSLRLLEKGAKQFASHSAREFHFEFFDKTVSDTLEIGRHSVAEWLAERLCVLLTCCAFSRSRRLELRLSELGEIARRMSSSFDESLVLALLTNLVWSNRASLILSSQRFLKSERSSNERIRLKEAEEEDEDGQSEPPVAVCEPSGYSQLLSLIAVVDFELLVCDRRTAAGVSYDEQTTRDGMQNRLESALARFLQRMELAAENCESLYICPAALLHFFKAAIDLRLKRTLRLRGLFDRALQSVPWLKDFYVIGTQLFPEDAQAIYSMLSERGLRIRIPVEEIEILLE